MCGVYLVMRDYLRYGTTRWIQWGEMDGGLMNGMQNFSLLQNMTAGAVAGIAVCFCPLYRRDAGRLTFWEIGTHSHVPHRLDQGMSCCVAQRTEISSICPPRTLANSAPKQTRTQLLGAIQPRTVYNMKWAIGLWRGMSSVVVGAGQFYHLCF